MDKITGITRGASASNLVNDIKLLSNLVSEIGLNCFTGQIRLNFHKGNLSEKIEKKESLKLE